MAVYRLEPHTSDKRRFGRTAVALLAPQRDKTAPHFSLLSFSLLSFETFAGVINAAFPSCNHDGYDCLTRAPLDDASTFALTQVTGWQVEQFREPVENNCFQFRDGGRTDPVEGGSGEGGGVELSEHGRIGGRGGIKGHKIGGLP